MASNDLHFGTERDGDHPDRDDELQVLSSHRVGEPIENLQPVLDAEQGLLFEGA